MLVTNRRISGRMSVGTGSRQQDFDGAMQMTLITSSCMHNSNSRSTVVADGNDDWTAILPVD
jgi:hypothetical protein